MRVRVLWNCHIPVSTRVMLTWVFVFLILTTNVRCNASWLQMKCEKLAFAEKCLFCFGKDAWDIPFFSVK